MEKTPEVENKYAELTAEERFAELEKIKTAMSESEVEKAFTIKTEKSEPEVKEVKVESISTAIKLDPQIEMVAKTLMSQAEEKVKGIYKDFDFSGIKNADVDTLTKVTLMSTLAEPNARKMATIEKNLKSNEAEGTTETKSAEFSARETEGKVDKDAGKKLLTEMSEKLGFIEEETSE